MALFSRKTLELCAESLARYLPNDDMFSAKKIPSSNLYKFISGLASEICRAQGYLLEFDTLPDNSTKFVSEWESALGIPDSCFDASGTLEDRRRNVLFKLASGGLQTLNDYEILAALFDLEIEIEYQYPFEMGISGMGDPVGGSEWRHVFTIIITNFADEVASAIFECNIQRMRAAHTVILFDYQGGIGAIAYGEAYTGAAHTEGEIITIYEAPGYLLDENGNRILAEDGSPILTEQL